MTKTHSLQETPINEFFNNEIYMKMLLEYCIETKRDTYKTICSMKQNKIIYEMISKKIHFHLIIADKLKNIVGFIMEEYKLIHENVSVLGLDIIYIIPSQRNKGICSNLLLEYSNKERVITASNRISKLYLTNPILWPRYMPKQNANGDGTRTLMSKAFLDNIDNYM